MVHNATVGSISSGTLRTQDLLDSFHGELAYLDRDGHKELLAEAETLLNVGHDSFVDDENASQLVNDMVDALNDLAPPYCYFGSHEGDGANFGFWPSMDAIEELPRIENVEGEDIPAEDHCYVNDHGNVTVYNGAGEVILELV